jgi:error-prone DNA polymerase
VDRLVVIGPGFVWPSGFEQNRRAILGATLVGCCGCLPSANGVIHVIVEQIADLLAELKGVSGFDTVFPIVSGRDDEAKRAEAV